MICYMSVVICLKYWHTFIYFSNGMKMTSEFGMSNTYTSYSFLIIILHCVDYIMMYNIYIFYNFSKN